MSDLGFSIEQDVTTADLVVQKLDLDEVVKLKFNDEQEYLLKDTLELALITSCVHLYSVLSGYGSGLISLEDFDQQESQLRITAVKVRVITGEVHLSIRGHVLRVASFLSNFLMRTNKKDQPYIFQTLVATHTTFDPSESSEVFFQLDQLPFGSVPGRLVTLSSHDMPKLINALMNLSHNKANKINRMTANKLIKFGRPPLKTLDQSNKTVRNTAKYSIVDNDESAHGSMGESSYSLDTENKKTCSLVELNKREVTYLIGKNGWKIAALRAKSGAHIKVVPLNNHLQTTSMRFNDPNNKQFIRVTGTHPEVSSALSLIKLEIQHFRVNEITNY